MFSAWILWHETPKFVIARSEATWRPERAARGSALGVQSREGTCSPYRLPLKWHAPIASVAALTAQPLAALPPYGCGVPFTGGERLAGWQCFRHGFYGMRPPSLSLRGAKRRGALSAQREEVPLGCNLAGPGWITGHSRRKRNCLPEIATAPLGPRNDNSGAFAILTAAYTGRKCVAGRGQPGPYIA